MTDTGRRESRSLRDRIMVFIGAATSLYVILYVTNILPLFGLLVPLQVFLASILMIALVFVFILFRASKRETSSRIPWYDYLFIAASLVSMGYIVFNYQTVFSQLGVGFATSLQSALFILATVAILEGTRRSVGLPITILSLLFLLQVFFSNHLPGLLQGRGYDLDRVAYVLYLSMDGIFGTPIRVVITIVMAFLIFGKFLEDSGATGTFTRLPMALVGHVRGGPAKVAVGASGLMAMMSGSAIANVAATGTVTIPLMKKTGYDKDFAGAVESVASSGGALTPPVMGGAIFLMSEWLNTPYITLCFYAIFPAFLYYLNVFMVVDLEAARKGLKGLPREALPSALATLRAGWMHFVPMVLLVYLLAVLRLTPETAALYSVGLLVIISMLKKETFPTARRLVNALDGSFRQALSVLMAVASAGIVIGALAVTGLALKLGAAFIQLSAGNLAVMLILSAIAAFIMGMGMHAVVIYIILAVTLAPSLVLSGVPDVCAHFFVFVTSMLSLITPPVALAVFTAVAISGGSIMKTGFHATRLGIVLFILPFWFVYRPSILMLGTPLEIVTSAFAAIVAILALSAGTMGYWLVRLKWPERVILIIGALMLIAPQLWNDIIGYILIGLTGIWVYFKRAARNTGKTGSKRE
jgi:TRAP transporter 4TM/12TM fusion protein